MRARNRSRTTRAARLRYKDFSRGQPDPELERARDAVALIEARGYARKKKLGDELAEQIARWKGVSS